MKWGKLKCIKFKFIGKYIDEILILFFKGNFYLLKIKDLLNYGIW